VVNSPSFKEGATGASVVAFDVMQETLDLTTLGSLKTGDQVNVERSLKVGDEVGGHVVSGHVHGTAKIVEITKTENNVTITLEPLAELSKYIFPKGFIALNGVSLTVVSSPSFEEGATGESQGGHGASVAVSLIPETLARTTFGAAQVGDLVNIEVDQQTRTIVDTIERINL
jgi:riboflavin synthase